MRRALRRLAAVLLALSSLGLLLLSAALSRPSLLINTGTASWALRRFGAAYEPRWRSLRVELRSDSLRHKRLELDAGGFCFAAPDGSLEGCLERVELRLGVVFGPGLIERVDLSRLLVEGGRLRADRTRAAVETGAAARSFALDPGLLAAPRWIARARVGTVDVRLPRNEIVLSAASSAAGSLALSRAGPKAPFEFALRGESRARGGRRPFRARLALHTDLLQPRPSGARSWSGRAELSARAPGRSARGRLSLSGEPEGVRGALSLDVRASSAPLRRAVLAPCALALRGRGRPERASLSCGFSLEPAALSLREGLPPLQKTVDGRVEWRARFPRPSDPGRFESELALSLSPARGWYELTGRAKAKVSGRLERLPGSLEIEHEAHAELRLREFQALVAFLRGTNWEVPAPVHRFGGPLALELRTRGRPGRRAQRLDWRLRSDLSGGVQRLKVEALGELACADVLASTRSFALRADATLQDVELQLPYLRPEAPPKVRLDPRIRSGAAPEPARRDPAPRHSLRLTLRTAGKPVRVHSNLLQEPVPLELELSAASPPPLMGSTITVRRFNVELFRRKAVVEGIRLTASPGSRLMSLDGAILYETADARITIRLLGTTAKPVVDFSSDPPLDRDQILALLLYGKPPSLLEPHENDSVGNMDAALASKAFGAASLYLFASTPIDFVGYDPASRAFTVRLRLPGGASMELGSGTEEERRLRLRKRLAAHWVVETELKDASQERQDAVTTFVEWFNRY